MCTVLCETANMACNLYGVFTLRTVICIPEGTAPREKNELPQAGFDGREVWTGVQMCNSHNKGVC